MRDIHCPKDIGFENTFSGEDCEKEQHYNNCYHCWSTALAKGIEMCKVDVLDKIRAEILEEILSHSGTGEEVIQAYADGLKKGLDIIDKYKAESEDKE